MLGSWTENPPASAGRVQRKWWRTSSVGVLAGTRRASTPARFAKLSATFLNGRGCFGRGAAIRWAAVRIARRQVAAAGMRLAFLDDAQEQFLQRRRRMTERFQLAAVALDDFFQLAAKR